MHGKPAGKAALHDSCSHPAWGRAVGDNGPFHPLAHGWVWLVSPAWGCVCVEAGPYDGGWICRAPSKQCDLGHITPSHRSLSLGERHCSNNFLSEGRCETALGHCCPGKGFGCTLVTQETAASVRWGLTAGTRRQKRDSSQGHQPPSAPGSPALRTMGELGTTCERCHVPLWLQSRGSFLSRDF